MAITNVLQTAVLREMSDAVLADIVTNEYATPAALHDGVATLLFGVDNTASGTNYSKTIVSQVLDFTLKNNMVVGGQLADVGTIDSDGTGYVVGDVLPVYGSTGGSGAALVVTSVNAGAITGLGIHSVGDNYSGTITVSSDNVAGSGLTFTTAPAVSYEPTSVITALLADAELAIA